MIIVKIIIAISNMVIISLKVLTNCIILLNCITRVDPGVEMVERQEEDTAVTSLPLLDQQQSQLESHFWRRQPCYPCLLEFP